MTQPPGSRLKPLTTGTRHLDPNNLECYVQALAEVGTKFGPGVGIDTQTMVDMNRRQLKQEPRTALALERVQQHDRVETPGETNTKPRTRQQAAGKERRKRLRDPLRASRLDELSVPSAL